VQTPINSCARWVDTGLRLTVDETYELRATGTWKNASIVTDADGYASVNHFQHLTERRRRMPHARWFALIGAIDRRKETQFVMEKAVRCAPIRLDSWRASPTICAAFTLTTLAASSSQSRSAGVDYFPSGPAIIIVALVRLARARHGVWPAGK
jgi:hypothetical protein